ncbi:MAG: hypothetical protein RLZZ230_355 [Candidatus Parcubacteria bacterium]|jgi:hypothetical protein
MVVEHLLNFAILICLQLFFFVIHAVSVGEKKQIFTYLGKGMLLGLPFGIIFDLVVGKYFGLFDYELGYQMWFLVLNGIFSYGFMTANVILLRQHSLLHMYFWSSGLGLIYEIINHFFPVWQFTFGSALTEWISVVFVLYTGLIWLIMVALRLVYRIPFQAVSFVKL